MGNIVFEKISDIDSTYPYLCVYEEGDRVNPFMEIAVNENKELEFTMYPFARNVVLTMGQWEEIQSRAKIFLTKSLADEDAS